MPDEQYKQDMIDQFGSMPLSAFELWPEKDFMELSASEYARIPDYGIEIDNINPYYYGDPAPLSATTPTIIEITLTGAASALPPPDPIVVGPENPLGYYPVMDMIWVLPDDE